MIRSDKARSKRPGGAMPDPQAAGTLLIPAPGRLA